MINRFAVIPVLAILVGCFMSSVPILAEDAKVTAPATVITLPAPTSESKVTVEQAIKQRRSVRTYANEPLTLQQVSQLLYSAQGITDPATGHRAAPSAQATYPVKLYLVAANVKDLPAGVYLYVPQGHKLQLVVSGDQRANVGPQPQMQKAPALFVFSADFTEIGPKYGARADRFASLEVGHSAQNILLEEVALGLIGVPMGGFDEAKIKPALKMTEKEVPMYVVSAAKKG